MPYKRKENILDEVSKRNRAAQEVLPSPRIANLVCQYHKQEGRKDGSGRITFEFGAESMLEVHKILTEHSRRPTNFHVIVIPEDLVMDERDRMDLAEKDS
jgi:hypothetical protein